MTGGTVVEAQTPGQVAVVKREGYLSWDDYFMSVAFLTAMRSKDPNTQVGACIVNEVNRIVGIGYNGFPSGIPDDALPWAKTSPDGELATKHPYVCHAELNAVLNKNAESCRGCRLYCTLFPCNECAKVIIQSGITRVVYASAKNSHQNSYNASKSLFHLAGVETSQYVPKAEEVLVALRYPQDRRQEKADKGQNSTELPGFGPATIANLQASGGPEMPYYQHDIVNNCKEKCCGGHCKGVRLSDCRSSWQPSSAFALSAVMGVIVLASAIFRRTREI